MYDAYIIAIANKVCYTMHHHSVRGICKTWKWKWKWKLETELELEMVIKCSGYNQEYLATTLEAASSPGPPGISTHNDKLGEPKDKASTY